LKINAEEVKEIKNSMENEIRMVIRLEAAEKKGTILQKCIKRKRYIKIGKKKNIL
jgi:hypothetical protein